MATSGTVIDVTKVSRICTGCGKRKLLSNFSPHKKNPSKVWHYMARCKPCNKEYDREFRKRSPKNGFNLVVGKLRRGHRRAQHGFNIDADFLLELWHKQEGKCALTGLPMTYSQGLNPFSVSVDRIVPKKGYYKKNVRLICFAVNSLRGAGSDEAMYTIAEALVARRVK